MTVRMTSEARNILLQTLYEAQGLAVDDLEGTRQLRELTATYSAETGIPVDEALMLRRLRGMAEAGDLPDVAPVGGQYLVDVTVPVRLETVVRAIAWTLNRGGPLPATRTEGLAAVRAYFLGAGQGTVGYPREAWSQAELLFPELIIPRKKG